MKIRQAGMSDIPVLAQLNRQLIEDECHRNPMDEKQLADRMRRWLKSDYDAALFETDGRIVAYALYRQHEYDGILLRHFFVARDARRKGVGTQAFNLFRTDL